MLDKNDLKEITQMLLTVQKEMMSDMAKMFLAIEKEHFRENVLWVRKGRRLQMASVANHMKICLRSIDKDRERNLSDESILGTTVGAISSFVEVCEDELRNSPGLAVDEIRQEG